VPFLLAERAIKTCSLDARSKGQPRPLPLRKVSGVGRASFDARNRGSTRPPYEERHELALKDHLYRSMRAVETMPAPSLKKECMGKVGASGWVGFAGLPESKQRPRLHSLLRIGEHIHLD